MNLFYVSKKSPKYWAFFEMKERRYTLYLQWKTFMNTFSESIHPCDSFFFCSQIILVSLALSNLEYYTPPERGASSSQGYPLVLFCHYPFTHLVGERERDNVEWNFSSEEATQWQGQGDWEDNVVHKCIPSIRILATFLSVVSG